MGEVELLLLYELVSELGCSIMLRGLFVAAKSSKLVIVVLKARDSCKDKKFVSRLATVLAHQWVSGVFVDVRVSFVNLIHTFELLNQAIIPFQG